MSHSPDSLVENHRSIFLLRPQNEQAADPLAKKRGRPPKKGVAMTPAERKAASRADQKQKQQDVERQKMIAALVKMYRRPQREFDWLSIKELDLSLESKPVETRGRLRGERQAEDKSLEQIALMRERKVVHRVRPRGTGPDG